MAVASDVALEQLAGEHALFALLVKSSKRQHGAAVYYRKLDVAARHLARACALCGAAGARPQQKIEALNRVQQLLRAAFFELEGLLAQSFFMPFALTGLASSARLATLAAHVAVSVARESLSAQPLDSSWLVGKVAQASAVPRAAPALPTLATRTAAVPSSPTARAGPPELSDTSDEDDLGAPLPPRTSSGMAAQPLLAPAHETGLTDSRIVGGGRLAECEPMEVELAAGPLDGDAIPTASAARGAHEVLDAAPTSALTTSEDEDDECALVVQGAVRHSPEGTLACASAVHGDNEVLELSQSGSESESGEDWQPGQRVSPATLARGPAGPPGRRGSLLRLVSRTRSRASVHAYARLLSGSSHLGRPGVGPRGTVSVNVRARGIGSEVIQ
ncbi:hypothetical protein T492DRAFT_1099107 [Pavlovales sp. CCMP2436]|nr:hypothetical protein T492DRAFT_1099107 [Pavlovales sp. CCMP2436]